MLKCNPNVLAEKTEDGGILYNPDLKECHEINRAAYLVWTSIKKTRNLNSIVKEMTETFITDRKEQEIKSDVKRIILEFQRHNLLLDE